MGAVSPNRYAEARLTCNPSTWRTILPIVDVFRCESHCASMLSIGSYVINGSQLKAGANWSTSLRPSSAVKINGNGLKSTGHALNICIMKLLRHRSG